MVSRSLQRHDINVVMNGTAELALPSPVVERMRHINSSIRMDALIGEEEDRKTLQAVEKIRTSLERTTVAQDDHAQSLQQAAPAHRGSTEHLVFVNHALAPISNRNTDLRDINSNVKMIDQGRAGSRGSLSDWREHTAMQGNGAASNLRRSASITLDRAGQKEAARSEDSNQTVFLMSSILTQRIKEMEQRMLVTIALCHQHLN